jgi:hypothetical protein
MTARLYATAGVAALAIAAGAAAPVAAPSEKLALVTVVADPAQPAAALTPSDFTVTEDRKPVKVTEAVPAKDPLSVVLLVDTALPADGSAATPELRKALTTFVRTLLAGEPGAQIAVYQVANAATPLRPFTSDRADLEAGIGVLASGSAAGSAMLEGVVTAARLVGGRPAPRRAIVCVAIGTTEGTVLEPKAVGDAVRQSGATLWVVSVESSSDASLTNRDTVWTRVTADTGGLRQNVVQATRLESRLQVVAGSLLSQYFLKMTRSADGAVKGFAGQTSGGQKVLFTHWMR